MTRRRLLIISSLIIAIVAVVPVRIRTIPPWSLQCVDGFGAPVAGPEILRNSAFFSFGSVDTDRKTCGSDGFVRFPEKTFVAPLAVGGIMIAMDYLNEIASPHGALSGGYAVVWSNEYPNADVIWHVSGRELPARIRVNHHGAASK